jgi:hypothetical protein
MLALRKRRGGMLATRKAKKQGEAQEIANLRFQIFKFEIHSLQLNFKVTYPSGIILTEASSIVETTHTKPRKRMRVLKGVRLGSGLL